MSLRSACLAGGLAVVAVALGAVAVGADPFATASNPERIDVITRATAINDFVDIGPAGPSPGDVYVFIDTVYLAKAPSQKVGEALGRCTVIDPDPAAPRLGCNITTTFSADDGITTDGTLLNVPGTTSTGAITGGTGRFRNARGDAALDLGPPGGPHRVSFRMILQP